jgi:hypothetical protein
MDRWLKRLRDAVFQALFEWKAADCSAVADKIEAFMAAWNVYKAALSPARRLIKDSAKAVAVGAMRDFANSSIRYNSNMSDDDKLFFGIHAVKAAPTPSPVPKSWPVSSYDLNTFRQIGVVSVDSVSGRKALPRGVRSVEHAWIVFQPGSTIPKPLPDIILFNRFKNWTRPRETCKLEFTEALRRGAIAHTSRWINTCSEPGPWGPVVVVTIP